MPIVVRKSVLLFFVCFIFFALAEKPPSQSPRAKKAVITEPKPGGKKSSLSKPALKSSKNRKPGGDFLDKESLLGEEYYKPEAASAEVQARTLQHISAVEKVCKSSLPFAEKAGLLTHRLKKLNAVIDLYLKKPYLLTPDRLFLQHIKENISPIALFAGLAQTYAFAKNQDLDFSDNFLRHYYGYFNIEEGEKLTVKGLKDEWAVKIYKALTCLKN